MIGTIDEAQEIFDAVGDRYKIDYDPSDVPPGWTYLGAGGTRSVYLSPTGVAYKINHNHIDEGGEPSPNDIEHHNFEVIAKKRKLPPKWRVPNSHLHCWNGRYKRYNFKSMEVEPIETRVVVLACDYIKGVTFHDIPPHWNDMCTAFDAAGLYDTVRSNAMIGEDGYKYIVDAAEDYLPMEEAA